MELSRVRHGFAGRAQPAFLEVESLELTLEESFCFVGANGSGKSLLAGILAGAIEPQSGELRRVPARREWISFESSQARYEAELAQDDTDFTDEVDFGTTGLELLRESQRPDDHIRRVAGELGIAPLLDRGCRQFSSGEWRRVELARALLCEPELLILDEPFESLDAGACVQLRSLLLELRVRGVGLVLFVSRLEDVPEFCDRVGVLVHGRLARVGPRAELIEDAAVRQLFAFDPSFVPALPTTDTARISPLIVGRALSVRYGEVTQFAPFDWQVEPGEHTRIVGPNGSGKSTLLGLVTGDHPQCYSNDLSVVGYRRGSGESIWDVKKRIGIVSPALHRDYRAPATALTVVVSGFFDSIGLYEEPTRDQLRLARKWLDVFDLGGASGEPFRALSHGQQRLLLCARALVKTPPLLVLDEPTAGLDAINSAVVLHYAGRLTALGMTTVLFVSHRPDERVSGIARVLEFLPSAEPHVRYEVRTARAEE